MLTTVLTITDFVAIIITTAVNFVQFHFLLQVIECHPTLTECEVTKHTRFISIKVVDRSQMSLIIIESKLS